MWNHVRVTTSPSRVALSGRVATAAVGVLALLTGLAAPVSAAPAPASSTTTATADPGIPGLESWGVGQARPAPQDADVEAPEALSSSPAPAPGSAEAKVAASASAAVAATSWVVRGAGWGHSLGMSQYGAMEMAKDGYTASQILRHYYTGTTYDAVTDNQTLRVNVLHQTTSFEATPSALVSGRWSLHGG